MVLLSRSFSTNTVQSNGTKFFFMHLSICTSVHLCKRTLNVNLPGVIGSVEPQDFDGDQLRVATQAIILIYRLQILGTFAQMDLSSTTGWE